MKAKDLPTIQMLLLQRERLSVMSTSTHGAEICLAGYSHSVQADLIRPIIQAEKRRVEKELAELGVEL